MTGLQRRARIAQCHRRSPCRWDASCQDQCQVRVQQQFSVGTWYDQWHRRAWPVRKYSPWSANASSRHANSTRTSHLEISRWSSWGTSTSLRFSDIQGISQRIQPIPAFWQGHHLHRTCETAMSRPCRRQGPTDAPVWRRVYGRRLEDLEG